MVSKVWSPFTSCMLVLWVANHSSILSSILKDLTKIILLQKNAFLVNCWTLEAFPNPFFPSTLSLTDNHNWTYSIFTVGFLLLFMNIISVLTVWYYSKLAYNMFWLIFFFFPLHPCLLGFLSSITHRKQTPQNNTTSVTETGHITALCFSNHKTLASTPWTLLLE